MFRTLLSTDKPGAAQTAKQQKSASAEHGINPLSETGVLQRVLDYVGPGQWLLMSLVSKDWLESYSQVPEQQLNGHFTGTEFICKPRMTLLGAAVASASVIEFACALGLPLNSSR
jgi:hypothetical protein